MDNNGKLLPHYINPQHNSTLRPSKPAIKQIAKKKKQRNKTSKQAQTEPAKKRVTWSTPLVSAPYLITGASFSGLPGLPFQGYQPTVYRGNDNLEAIPEFDETTTHDTPIPSNNSNNNSNNANNSSNNNKAPKPQTTYYDYEEDEDMVSDKGKSKKGSSQFNSNVRINVNGGGVINAESIHDSLTEESFVHIITTHHNSINNGPSYSMRSYGLSPGEGEEYIAINMPGVKGNTTLLYSEKMYHRSKYRAR